MSGTISSLGLGSGVLTATTMDKLKANDESLMITPITNQISLETQKSQALSLLSSLMTTFKSSASALDDDALYQQRNVSGTNSGVSVTADAGVSVQSFSISNTQLAMQNVKESGSFSSTSTPGDVASGSGSMTITIDGTDYNIPYTSSTTLSDLKDSINNIAGTKVKASTLQVGTNDYRLVLSSVDTGANQTITISDSASGSLNSALLSYDATTNPSGMQEVQAARDASFQYNGITVTRSSNNITDIISGVTINLLEDSGSANISISQDISAISDEMTTFVSSYNSLISQLTSMTTADTANGTTGIFNGDTTVNGISREINRILSSMDTNGLSLSQYGIDLSEKGVMSFNSSTFTSKFESDPSASETFFSGGTAVNANGTTSTVDGVFTSLNNLLDKYTKSSGILSNLTDYNTKQLTALNDNQTRTQALIDARYETMAAQWTQYDTLISQLNNNFSALQQMINSLSSSSSSSG